MKKLMKVLALATAICMLLSVSAFAADTISGNPAAKTVNIKINTGSTEEVAVLIVRDNVAPADAEDTDILYINQVSANADSEYDLGAVELLDPNVDAVDVWVGSASLAAANNNTAKKYDVDLKVVEDKETITIVDNSLKKANYTQETLETDAEGGTGIVMQLNYKVKNAISDIIFAFKPVGATDKLYSAPVKASNVFSALEATNAVQLAVAFSNGNIDKELNMVEIDTVDLIVKTVDAQGNKVSVLFTDSTDETKEFGYQAPQN